MHPRGFRCPIVEGPGHVIRLQDDAGSSSLKKSCRCRSSCITPRGQYYASDARLFHTGRRYGIEVNYRGTSTNQSGCQLPRCHVCPGRARGSAARTRPLLPGVASCVFALDCEMSFTIRGFEVIERSYTAGNATTAYCACLRPQRPRLEHDLRRRDGRAPRQRAHHAARRADRGAGGSRVGDRLATLQKEPVHGGVRGPLSSTLALVGFPGPRGYGGMEDAKNCMDLVLRKVFCDVKLSDAATSSLGNSPRGRR
ncbi:hypothetical protein HPB48_003184 [Haemaphysalis longicornis]|uniref:Uncharacterized protein n=1 Tax=Haemaphysalis longicornis TaxID=44386 RepID=A0A9J6H3B6_HAELO|nr:hypothetical protein HPB48_003184 [Haemaphysalis longicornis]